MEVREYTKRQFMNDLFEVSSVWVDEKMVKLAEKSDELWENKVARKLIMKCAMTRRAYEGKRRALFDEKAGIDTGFTSKYLEEAKETSGQYTMAVFDAIVSEL